MYPQALPSRVPKVEDCISMDISKIISDSLDKSIKEVASGKFDDYYGIDDEHLAELSNQDAMLMNYANILLTTYHRELTKELSKHGIEL